MVFPRLPVADCLMGLTPTGRTSDCLNMILRMLVPGGTRREGAWLRRVGFLFGHLRRSQGNRSCLSQIPKSRPESACFWASGSLCRLVVTMCWRAESFRQQSTNAKRSKSVGLGGREAKTWKWDFSSVMATKTPWFWDPVLGSKDSMLKSFVEFLKEWKRFLAKVFESNPWVGNGWYISVLDILDTSGSRLVGLPWRCCIHGFQSFRYSPHPSPIFTHLHPFQVFQDFRVSCISGGDGRSAKKEIAGSKVQSQVLCNGDLVDRRTTKLAKQASRT